MDSARNRPAEYESPQPAAATSLAQLQAQRDAVRDFIAGGMEPDAIAAEVLEAIRNDTFYVVPAQDNIEAAIALRLDDIRLRRNPTIVSQ